MSTGTLSGTFPGVGNRAEQTAQVLADLASTAGPGARLGTKQELQERLGVSRGTLNTALQLSESRGVVSTRTGPGGGIFAAQPAALARIGHAFLALDSASTRSTVDDAMRVRDALDPLTVQGALRHSSAADIERMRECLADREHAISAQDSLQFMHTNWNLHLVIAGTSPNAVLRTMYAGLIETIRDHTVGVQMHDQLPEYVQERHQLHVDLVDALDRRDAAAAEAIMQRHLVAS